MTKKNYHTSSSKWRTIQEYPSPNNMHDKQKYLNEYIKEEKIFVKEVLGDSRQGIIFALN